MEFFCKSMLCYRVLQKWGQSNEGENYNDLDQNYDSLSNSYQTNETVERPPNYEKYWLGEKEGKCHFCGKVSIII